MRTAFVYILTNFHHTVFYIGTTNNLLRRTYEHREGLVEGFTKRFQVKKLVYYEQLPTMPQAIAREKQLKRWHREWKKNLITQFNPDWHDLYDEVSLSYQANHSIN